MPVKVVTDSTCDLPPTLVESLGITVVPLSVIFGEEAFLDGVELSAADFYERLKTSTVSPRTSQPSVAAFVDTYGRLGAEGDEIVSVHISSRLSGTLQSATIAREEVAHEIHIELIDSYNVSMGLGNIVMDAALVARDGGTLEQVAAAARSAMDRSRLVAEVDTLEYLRRGGRVGRAASLVGSLLSIKPLVQVEQGEVAPFERVRTRAKAIQRLFEIATRDRTAQRCFVGSAGSDDEAAAFLERLRPHMPHTEFHLGQIGPVVGTHAGPGAIGVALLRRA